MDVVYRSKTGLTSLTANAILPRLKWRICIDTGIMMPSDNAIPDDWYDLSGFALQSIVHQRASAMPSWINVPEVEVNLADRVHRAIVMTAVKVAVRVGEDTSEGTRRPIKK